MTIRHSSPRSTESVVTAIAARMWGQALMPIVALLNLFVFFTPDFLRKADRVKAHGKLVTTGYHPEVWETWE